MKILIFYTSALGLGHKRSAESIFYTFKKIHPSYDVRLINSLSLISTKFENFVSFFYGLLLKNLPALWGYIYTHEKKYPLFRKIGRRIILFIASRKFRELLSKENPNIVITTQVFPNILLSQLKKQYSYRLVSVLTDFGVHSYWFDTRIDLFFVSHDDIKTTLLRNGISKEKIFVSGIPIHSSFKRKTKKNKGKKTILVVGGGAGLGYLKDIVRSLSSLRDKYYIDVITGNNKKIKEEIEITKIPRRVFGFVQDIHFYYEESDLVITKPGGLTTSELIAMRLPIVITNPLPGQEEINTAYLVKKGLALYIKVSPVFAEEIEKIIENRKLLKKMKESAKNFSKEDPSFLIVQTITEYMLSTTHS